MHDHPSHFCNLSTKGRSSTSADTEGNAVWNVHLSSKLQHDTNLYATPAAEDTMFQGSGLSSVTLDFLLDLTIASEGWSLGLPAKLCLSDCCQRHLG